MVLPKNKQKEGTELFTFAPWIDDNGKPKIQLRTWVIRSIRRPRRTEIEKRVDIIKTPLVKISNKVDGITFEKGQWVDHILKRFSDYTLTFNIDSPLPYDLWTTELAAIKSAVANSKSYIKSCKDTLKSEPECGETIQELQEEMLLLPVLERKLNKLKS